MHVHTVLGWWYRLATSIITYPRRIFRRCHIVWYTVVCNFHRQLYTALFVSTLLTFSIKVCFKSRFGSPCPLYPSTVNRNRRLSFAKSLVFSGAYISWRWKENLANKKVHQGPHSSRCLQRQLWTLSLKKWLEYHYYHPNGTSKQQ